MIGPEERLWVAVLVQAILDVRKTASRMKKDPLLWEKRNIRGEILRLKKWFRSELFEPGSFTFCCDVAGFDFRYVRTQIEQKYFNQIDQTRG